LLYLAYFLKMIPGGAGLYHRGEDGSSIAPACLGGRLLVVLRFIPPPRESASSCLADLLLISVQRLGLMLAGRA